MDGPATAPAPSLDEEIARKANEGAPPPPPSDPLSAERDSLGRPFDPAKFKPEKDTLGRWKNLHAGRGGAARRAAASAAGDPPPANFDDIEKAARGAASTGGTGDGAAMNPSDEYVQAAAGVVAGISTVAILAMGAHVAPTAEQTAAMVRAYADSFRVYGVAPKAPPWIAPAIATAAWVGPHLADRRSQERLQGWRARWVNFVLWFRGRRDAGAATAAARDAATATAAP